MRGKNAATAPQMNTGNKHAEKQAATSTVAAMYGNHTTAEAAVQELQRSGYDMRKLSILGRDPHTEEHIVGYYNTGDRMRYWGKRGGIWGFLIGSAFFWIPGIGPVLVGGPLVATIVSTLEGAAMTGGMSAIGAALFSLGIPRNTILNYETELKADKFLVIAHGTASDVEQARDILSRTGASEIEVHGAR